MGKKILGFLVYMLVITGGILWFASQDGVTEADALALLLLGLAGYLLWTIGYLVHKRKKKKRKAKKTGKAGTKQTEAAGGSEKRKNKKSESEQVYRTVSAAKDHHETSNAVSSTAEDGNARRKKEESIRKKRSEKGRYQQEKSHGLKRKKKIIPGILIGSCVLCAAGIRWVQQRQDIPESLLAMEEKYPEATDFVNQYPRRKHDRKIDIASEVKSAREKNEIPFFLQWDERWGYETYGSDFLAVTGCGPTCVSMVVCGLTGDDRWNPLQVAKYSEKEGYYISGEGTSWSLMTEGAATLGLTAESVTISEETIRAALQAGTPVICSMYPGDFTYTGHFIVLTGIDENGSITVNDPNSRVNTEKHWPMEELLPQIRQGWSYHAEKN